MARAKFIVQAQRSNGFAYIDCEVHRATSWAVIRIRKARIKSKEYTYRNFVSRHQTRTQAEGEALSHNLNAAGPTRQYRLGKRMEKLG